MEPHFTHYIRFIRNDIEVLQSPLIEEDILDREEMKFIMAGCGGGCRVAWRSSSGSFLDTPTVVLHPPKLKIGIIITIQITKDPMFLDIVGQAAGPVIIQMLAHVKNK